LEIYADEVDEGDIIAGQASQHGQGTDSKDDVHIDVGCATSHHQLDTDAQGDHRFLEREGSEWGKRSKTNILLLTIFT
jgi:hypothetical protein